MGMYKILLSICSPENKPFEYFHHLIRSSIFLITLKWNDKDELISNAKNHGREAEIPP